MNSTDSAEYLKKKRFYSQLLTVFGRKPVLEILQDETIQCHRLHMADSNKAQGIIQQMLALAAKRQLEVVYHDRQALSRISKNGKQDQGVCVDIVCPNYRDYRDALNQQEHSLRLLALDNITNPQNLGMIIRSACAGNINGILLPQKGCARLDSLVIKASAGTLFKAPVLRCEQLDDALKHYQKAGAKVVGLTGDGKKEISEYTEEGFTIYVLGNETEGLSEKILNLCDEAVLIPMNNGVESLNVAVAASLIAFRGLI